MDGNNQIVNALLEMGWHLEEMQRPSATFKPRVFTDGNAWCALLGEDLQQGVAGFGKSPDKACEDFDVAWFTCADTTCEGVRCPKCQKAKQVETVLGSDGA